ncbi:ankyrin [Daldinia sp. FL1419]|nr:ankyrin [Daldinia sp. FL1419]
MASLDDLPTEILHIIASFLTVKARPTRTSLRSRTVLNQVDLVSLTYVSSRLRNVFDPILWRTNIDLPSFDGVRYARSAVCWAVTRNRIDILEKAFRYGLNLGTAHQRHPLNQAAGIGHDAAVHWLLDHGVPINPTTPKESTPGSPKETRHVVPLLHSPLYEAIHKKRESTTLILLSRGASIWFGTDDHAGNESQQSAIHTAAKYGLMAIVRHLVLAMQIDVDELDSDQKTPLVYAVKQPNNEYMIKLLLELGADKNKEQNMRALASAISVGNFTNAMTLLDAGLKVDPRESNTSPFKLCAQYLRGLLHAPQDGDPMLCQASELIRKLIACGADVNAGPETPLGFAVQNGTALVVYELIRGGADVEMCTGSNQLKPIDLIWGLEDPVDSAIKGAILVSAGARLDVPTNYILNRTPLEVAISYVSVKDQNIPFHALLCSADRRNFRDGYLDELFQYCLENHFLEPAIVLMKYGVYWQGAQKAAYRWARLVIHPPALNNSLDELSFCLDFQFSNRRVEHLFEMALHDKNEAQCHLILERGRLSFPEEPRPWLHLAAGFGGLSLTRRLCRAGMDINALNKDYETPMMVALRANHPIIADLLVGLGADPFHPRPSAECRQLQSRPARIVSPFEYALYHGHHEYAERWWVESAPESIPDFTAQDEHLTAFMKKLQHPPRDNLGENKETPIHHQTDQNSGEYTGLDKKISGVRDLIKTAFGYHMQGRNWGIGP